MTNFGKFIGNIQTEWLDDGRKMKLLSSIKYIDPFGSEWEAPSGWIVDGASIPKFAWSFIGGPFEGKYRNASVIHDVGCDERKKAWQLVHEVFYWAMLSSNVEKWRAKIMYAAVYHFGPRWDMVERVIDVPIANQTGIQNDLLKRSEPGSTVQIKNLYHRRSTDNFNKIHQPDRVDFDIVIAPPPKYLSLDDFDNLAKKIKNDEAKGKVELSLEEIRKYNSIDNIL